MYNEHLKKFLKVLLPTVLLCFFIARCGHRPNFLPLREEISGAKASQARAFLIFLHGFGGSLGSMGWLDQELTPQLPSDVTLVRVEAPFGWSGKYWFDHDFLGETRESRIRVKQSILNIKNKYPQAKIVLSGFSQGGMEAIDVALQTQEVDELVAIAPCRGYYDLKSLTGFRKPFPATIVSGAADPACPQADIKFMVSTFESLGYPMTLITHPGSHEINDLAMKALIDSVKEK